MSQRAYGEINASTSVMQDAHRRFKRNSNFLRQIIIVG